MFIRPVIRLLVLFSLLGALASPSTRADAVQFASRALDTVSAQLRSTTANTTIGADTDDVVVEASSRTDTARVVRVVDGDTVVVRLAKKNVTVRLIGVNAPESVKPSSPVECYGKEASRYLSSLLPTGTKVTLTYDRQRSDRYKRTLAYVATLDGSDIQRALLSNGYATTMRIAPNTARAREFSALEAVARDSGAGLWGACPS